MSSMISRLDAGSVHGDRDILSSLVDHAPDRILLVTTSLEIVYSNQRGDAFLKGKKGSPVGRFLSDFVFPEDRVLFDLAVAQLLLLPRNAQSMEARFLDGQGNPVWMHAQLAAVKFDAGPDVQRIYVQLTDIDRRKRLEIEMRQAGERWHSALVCSVLGVWDHDLKTGQYFYSDTWKSLRGIPVEEEIDPDFEKWIRGVHPEDQDMVRAIVTRQSVGELNYYQFEYRERHRNGDWIWIECRGACLEWDEEGQPVRIVGTDTDVTSRKAAEETLARVSQRLELALDVSRIGVFEADIGARSSLWDDRLLAMFGLEGESNIQPVGRWKELVHPEDRQRAEDIHDSYATAEAIVSNAFRIIRPDGSLRHIRAHIAPIREGGIVRRIIGANLDVTDDVHIREELERAKTLAEAHNRELEVAKARIEYDALHDYLTGLPNRRFLDETLAKWMAADGACRPGLAIMHLDLDRFKEINDTLGHLAGDRVLRHTADVLREIKSENDFVARIGGDEFVILSQIDASSARLSSLAEDIIRTICQPIDLDGQACRIGASIGIAIDKKRMLDPGQLVQNADIALYRAKNRGRNRFEFFSADIQDRMFNTKRVSDGILSGLEKSEFIPFYQLQFHAGTLDLAGVETLARWRHPTKGIVSPDGFLAVAEDLDAIAEIDAVVLDQALRDFKLWEAAGLGIPKVSVNLSARRLEDAGFKARLAKLEFRPGSLSFELLESIFLDDCDGTVIENLRAIRDRGIGIEIDDFGTGHASIVSLVRIAPGTFKIARELTEKIVEAPEQRGLVGSIIDIGKSLHINVVAEGVETAEHVGILRDLGCDILQGFALAAPMPFDALPDFVRRQSWRG